MTFDLKALSGIHILVIGDVMLDRYLWGNVSRISPEAPVPVVRVQETSEVLGGAGNVAANLAGLECSVSVIGLCGADESGKRLKTLLTEKGIEDLLYVDESRPTITKSRIMARQQQLFRLDQENIHIFTPVTRDRLLTLFEDNLTRYQAVILSDYGKGFFQTPDMSRQIIDLCRKHQIYVLVDPKGKDWERYQGATCVTPNTDELTLVTGSAIETGSGELTTSALSVRKRFDLDWLLVTRGPKGMWLVDAKDDPFEIPAKTREVYDVSGAGDTVIAALAAGVASGLTFPKAAELANTAAGIVVGKLGTQPITRAELVPLLHSNSSDNHTTGTNKISSLEAAEIQVQAWRTSEETIIFTNGCYDLLHPGHIYLLHQARELGDRLVIGLNTDASVRRLKGADRPILPEQDRAAIMSALTCVDMVVLFDEDTPLSLIKALKPDVLVKGADYSLEQVVGRDVVESYGGKVRLIPLLQGYSTTEIANKVLSTNK